MREGASPRVHAAGRAAAARPRARTRQRLAVCRHPGCLLPCWAGACHRRHVVGARRQTRRRSTNETNKWPGLVPDPVVAVKGHRFAAGLRLGPVGLALTAPPGLGTCWSGGEGPASCERPQSASGCRIAGVTVRRSALPYLPHCDGRSLAAPIYVRTSSQVERTARSSADEEHPWTAADGDPPARGPSARLIDAQITPARTIGAS
jgi:hypothetical protein